QTNDPIIHFYETFLAEYDPKLRKARGVWYTPEPVVNFIVRAVDDILKTEFDLPQGLADTSKTKIKVPIQGSKKLQEKEVHKVQILDPATGTGTFLAEVVKFIYSKRFKAMQGAWSGYVDEHLIPRLNGFELLMASYSMAHLKLDMLLRETGYKATKNQRFNIYLTNSLEEHHPDTGTLFSNWLSTEANEANHIKRDTPVMCVIGNPPYAVSSTNKGEWIQSLLDVYKKNLNERKINIDDDYIKFIRYGQHCIDRNGEGILAYISSNSFLDGVTHRQMRKNLLETFNEIYIIDLHGNAKKNEVAKDGRPDQNVFDIMTGVSINIFVKSKMSKKLGKVHHVDVYGERDFKYNYLINNDFKSILWSEIPYQEPYFFFVPKDFSKENTYQKGISLETLFENKNTGIQTKNDSLTLQFSKDNILELENDFLHLEIDELRNKYGVKDGTWRLENAKNDLLTGEYNLVKILVKAFDSRYTLLNRKSSGFLGRPRYDTMKHMVSNKNLALLLSRQNKSGTVDSYFITTGCSEMKSAERTIQSYHFPLYLYPEQNGQQTLEPTNERVPNFDLRIVTQIADKLDLTFSNEKESTENTYAPIDLLDYIYAVLYSPTYREKYKEFLKIDFPRVPYPKNKDTFWQLVKLGGEIRQIHLLESPKVEEYITGYPIDGDNTLTTKIGKKDWEITDTKGACPLGRIWINAEQYFENIPLTAWEFYIGGYQPAQKWLKDRKGRTLNFDDILHYQKIIVALSETDRLMKEIDRIEIE
ncbi:MAG: N-6 DNA methylase, partial [Bacteroidetes bacterium]|nr:N-6 DNA methylase [Bacteroidota bacterium]MBT7492092.1 N-6 DNA methylase [Bacteroidota bacterium]